MRNYLELMIDFIKPLFSSTKIVYSYNLPLEKVRTEIEAVFDDSTKFLSFTDMRAHFTSNDSFEIDAKLNAATKGVQYHSILYGRIEYGELNKTNMYGTPTIFINDKAFVGPKPYRVYRSAINRFIFF